MSNDINVHLSNLPKCGFNPLNPKESFSQLAYKIIGLCSIRYKTDETMESNRKDIVKILEAIYNRGLLEGEEK